MTDAPKRIWADPPDMFYDTGFWYTTNGKTSYTRSDLCPTPADLRRWAACTSLPASREMRAAADKMEAGE